ncbi:MAG TPA: AMP-binding protein [Polyangiaceae bacterium]|jgi:long-chain acyl-CoA synthetase|nr:AMP-binding protein [Polyangiaceae bacterium]
MSSPKPNGKGSLRPSSGAPLLDLKKMLSGRRLVVIGGTGFLGKVWWSFLLSRFPDLERIYLVMRTKAGLSVEQRYETEVEPNAVLDPLRAAHGDHFQAFIRGKLTVVAGDVVQPFCGMSAELRDDLRSNIDAVVNVAGVVDFDPPLDEALEVNAFGVQNLVALARDLGNVPLLHTSTCYVAGNRTGHVPETDPRQFPFPRADELERSHWDPDREIAECLDVIEQARHRASDAFRQSHFLDEAKKNLLERNEPGRGSVLEAEVRRVKRKFVEARLAEMGMERAQFWGFPNTYTYTKAIGEQIAAASGLPFTIVRPAVVESTSHYPFPGWNEGVNTSAPLIFVVRQGGLQIPGSDNYLDVIPCDMVAAGLTLALGELLEGTAKPVYQLGSTDSNPCTMRRFFELSGLYKRKYFQRTGKGGPVISFLQSHWEAAMLSKSQFESYGPHAIAKQGKALSKLLKKAALGPAAPLFKPAAKLVDEFSEQQRKVGNVLGAFVPFTCEFHYIFRCENTRAAHARLSEAEQALVDWSPESINWREWFLDVHVPGLERWVFPQIEERIRRPKKAPERHETLPALLDEMADRFELAIALQRTEKDGLSRLSFREWQERAAACAARLIEAGVRPGDRVLLAAQNHPAWSIDFFGILKAGATVVPLDANIDATAAENLQAASGARIFIADAGVKERLGAALAGRIDFCDLLVMAENGSIGLGISVEPDDVAVLIYTSGTTGRPKGVQLTHKNLTSLVASLAPLFPLGKGDRVLSVLPLHHTFELTCGMLLPLSRGSRIVYLDELNADRLTEALQAGRITALIGVPALWEMLERRITARIAEHGAFASQVFEFAIELNRSLGKNLGVDTGKLLFGPVHHALGGHLKFLVSGGAALPQSTHHLFAGLGLHLAEGYGLTEASPVLSVAPGGPRAKPGHVGRAIPGVELKIDAPNAEGVGEVLARGPNVMLGYAGDEEATSAVLTGGWLRTGDLGKLDRKGQLTLVGRAKDVVVASSGENVYPDDVEARLGQLEQVKELTVLGVPDSRGGERLACVAVPESDDGVPRAKRHERVRAALDSAFLRLPQNQRPALTLIFDAPLPRTSTRKVKRGEVRRLIERALAATDAPQRANLAQRDRAANLVRAAAATIARRDPAQIAPEMTLRGDLAFDSLMLLELLVALEAQVGHSLDAERLSAAATIGEVEAILRETHEASKLAATSRIEKEAQQPLEIPPVLREAAMHWMGRAQMSFYDKVLRTKVTGRAFIPQNRSTIVAANHASHLDMGLVKYALGRYGEDLVSLAAQDYFFEGNRFRKAYFENFTNLVPMTRSGSLRQALRQAGDLLEQGKTVLLFPEGTRSTDGAIQEFKASLGHLALHHDKDILPVWLGGTHAALPKGSTLPRQRDVEARIGLPLLISDLKRLSKGLPMSEASRIVAKLAERAVSELSKGSVLDLSKLEQRDVVAPPPVVEDRTLAPVFHELKTRFVAGSVEKPVSYYFSLGDTERWSVRITQDTCEVIAGKVESPADCVLKTTPAMFTRIVREKYTPSPAEFVAGAVKSNNIQLLFTFQKAFQLQGTGN